MDRPHLISQALDALERGEVTSEALTSAALDKARRLQYLNIFATLDAKGAIAAAKESDAYRRSGRMRQLEGIPITVKDLFNASLVIPKWA